MSAVKIGASRQIVIPKKIYDELGLQPGDYMEVEMSENHLILTPKQLIEKHLAEGLEDLAEGRVHGPFDSPKDVIKSLQGPTKRNAAQSKEA